MTTSNFVDPGTKMKAKVTAIMTTLSVKLRVLEESRLKKYMLVLGRRFLVLSDVFR